MLQICENTSFAEPNRPKIPVPSGEASSDDTVNTRGGEKENSSNKNDDDTSNTDRAHITTSSDDSNKSVGAGGVLLLWHMVGQGPAVLAAGAVRVGCFFFVFCFFHLIFPIFLF